MLSVWCGRCFVVSVMCVVCCAVLCGADVVAVCVLFVCCVRARNLLGLLNEITINTGKTFSHCVDSALLS